MRVRKWWTKNVLSCVQNILITKFGFIFSGSLCWVNVLTFKKICSESSLRSMRNATNTHIYTYNYTLMLGGRRDKWHERSPGLYYASGTRKTIWNVGRTTIVLPSATFDLLFPLPIWGSTLFSRADRGFKLPRYFRDLLPRGKQNKAVFRTSSCLVVVIRRPSVRSAANGPFAFCRATRRR